jgi:SMI1-KNR4 cell-wall
MKTSSIEKLKEVIANLLIPNYSSRDLNTYTVSYEELEEIEKRIGHNLPEDYKYFCHNLGAGATNTYVSIYAVDSMVVDINLSIIKVGMSEINRFLNKDRKLELKNADCNEILSKNVDFLKSALVIGGFLGNHQFFFDLGSYSDDKSYDIYSYNIYEPNKSAVKVARGFTSFICDFCYSKSIADLFPIVLVGDTHEFLLGVTVPFIEESNI